MIFNVAELAWVLIYRPYRSLLHNIRYTIDALVFVLITLAFSLIAFTPEHEMIGTWTSYAIIALTGVMLINTIVFGIIAPATL